MSICSVADVCLELGIASPTEAQTAQITALIRRVESRVKKFLGYGVEQATYTHFLPNRNLFITEGAVLDSVNERVVVENQSDTRILQLPEIPVRSITSIYEDSAALAGQGANDFPVSSLLVSGTDYYLDVDKSGISRTGHVIRFFGAWAPRQRTIKVTYVAGYSSGELGGTDVDATGIQDATIEAVCAEYMRHRSVQGNAVGAVTGESISTTGHSVQYGTQSQGDMLGVGYSLTPGVQQKLWRYKRCWR